VIAVDTSSLRRFLSGSAGPDVDAVAASLDEHQMLLPPVVLAEILSEPRLQRSTIEVLSAIPLLEILDGYWIRTGQLRARMIAAGHKAKMADALIAQSCLDHDVALITHDNDFRHYERQGLVLA
jgi:predicted nucleic acid-binding protein